MSCPLRVIERTSIATLDLLFDDITALIIAKRLGACHYHRATDSTLSVVTVGLSCMHCLQLPRIVAKYLCWSHSHLKSVPSQTPGRYNMTKNDLVLYMKAGTTCEVDLALAV